MRKAVVASRGVVELVEVPVPEISDTQALVRVLRYSPYGTDVEIAAASEDRYRREYPIGIGVDFAGVIERVGSQVDGWRVGDTVTSAGLPACGTCRQCRAGQTNLCSRHIRGELPRQEVAQEYVAMESSMLTRIPPGVTLDDAAMLSGVMTAVNGFDLVRATAGDDCVVIGLGAMGLAAVAVAQAYGCRVVGVGVGAENQRLARAVGCGDVVELPGHDAVIADLVRDVVPDGPAVVFESTARAWGIREAFSICGYGSRVALLGGGPLPVDGWSLIERELTVVGVRAAPNKHKAMALVARGAVDLKQTITRRIPLDGLPQAFTEWIERSSTRAKGRVMVDVGQIA